MSTLAAGAQQVGSTADAAGPQLVASATQLDLGRPDLAAAAGLSYSSSTSSVADPVDAAAAERLDLAVDGAGQPPPRRRYGRPRYNDNSHNPDGSNKYTFVVGGGFTGPTGNTFHYLNTNFAFQVGGGRNFNKNFGVIAQFDYDNFGFNGRTLSNQEAIYCTPSQAAAGLCQPITNLDGKSHIWSFSLNPIYTLYSGPGIGAYVVAAVGFYHKVANFTLPSIACADYYCQYTYTANSTVDHYTSNAPGFNGGFGITYKASRFSGERLYAEARYVFVDNSQRQGVTVQNYNTFGQTYNGNNFYPANSNRTTYTVYKAGLRF